MTPEDRDLMRLRAFAAGDCWTDGLVDRNHCNRLEAAGLIKFKNSSYYERLYVLTEAGRARIRVEAQDSETHPQTPQRIEGDMTDDSKPDMTDDWMNPSMSVGYSFNQKEHEERLQKMPFIIQRAERVICSFIGSPPPPRWREWSRHATAGERDMELKRLHKEHPMWRLRPRNCDHLGHIIEPYGP